MAQLSLQKRKQILEKHKKRSSTREPSRLEPPAEFKKEKSRAGRWVAEHRLNQRSDGYEPRGFEPWKDPKTGKQVQVGDLVWCSMPKEDAEYRQAVVAEERDNMISTFQDKQAGEAERLNYELGNTKAVTDNIKINQTRGDS